MCVSNLGADMKISEVMQSFNTTLAFSGRSIEINWDFGVTLPNPGKRGGGFSGYTLHHSNGPSMTWYRTCGGSQLGSIYQSRVWNKQV